MGVPEVDVLVPQAQRPKTNAIGSSTIHVLFKSTPCEALNG
jgi:hypothetical protein